MKQRLRFESEERLQSNLQVGSLSFSASLKINFEMSKQVASTASNAVKARILQVQKTKN